MYKSSKASIIIDCEDKTLLPELEDRPLSSPEEDFTPHICHLCCCPEVQNEYPSCSRTDENLCQRKTPVPSTWAPEAWLCVLVCDCVCV
uniref:Uncharacterized protein n=1 Tax=Knipowitschia caucasica TaxID=637954 RepID=A0AAV2MSQ8_KNICA